MRISDWSSDVCSSDLNISGDPRDIPISQKVVENKPEDLVDACYINADLKVSDPALCEALFPYAGHPRLVAGGPLTEDVLKCQLRPLDPSDYSRDRKSTRLNSSH